MKQTYYTCFDETHRHRSERAADACMEKGRKKKLTRREVENVFRLVIFKRIVEGETSQRVANDFKMAPTRVIDITRQVAKAIWTRCKKNKTPVPCENYYIETMREHREFFLSRLRLLGQEIGVPDEYLK